MIATRYATVRSVSWAHWHCAAVRMIAVEKVLQSGVFDNCTSVCVCVFIVDRQYSETCKFPPFLNFLAHFDVCCIGMKGNVWCIMCTFLLVLTC
jgi:hypothetical protein